MSAVRFRLRAFGIIPRKGVCYEYLTETNMAPAKTKKKAAADTGKKQSGKGAGGLHLPSLAIKGFRGIKELELTGLGRVTLLMGANSTGKSTVLEAARIYASGGAASKTIGEILHTRDNVLERADEEGELIGVPDYESLFFGYGKQKPVGAIEIGRIEDKNKLRIRVGSYKSGELGKLPPQLLPIMEREGFEYLSVSFASNRRLEERIPFVASRRMWLRMTRLRSSHTIPSIPCEIMGPGLPSNEKIVSWYEKATLTPAEEEVLQSLHFINPDIERVAALSGGNRRSYGMRVMAKLSGVDTPVPLKSMGDGIVRLLGLALALVSAKDGFLLIDEVENGIHYELFPKLWDFVMRTAQKNNVQVIATTHSWDCVAGFAKASNELEEIKGHAFRIVRDGEDTRAVSYTEEELSIAAEGGIEVR